MSNARTLANTINSSSQIVVPSGGVNFGTGTDGTGTTVTGGILDDYEEGSYSATVALPSGSATTSVTYAKYRKVGSVVLIDMLLVLSVSSGGGNVNVTLPFSFNNTGGAFVGNSRTTGKSLSCLLQSVTNSFDFYRYDGSTAVANETYAITGFYFTN